MHIATLIPIARGIPFDTLTYYAPHALLPGTVVTIPFGKQTITGIVLETTGIAEAKSFIKGASFTLKKIATVVGTVPLFTAVMHALRETTTHTLVPTGAIAGAVLPNTLFEYITTTALTELVPVEIDITQHSEDAIVGTHVERLDYYKRLIRTAFAAKKSVLFIAPTIRALETWRDELQKGIPKHIVTIHSKITKRDIKSAYTLVKQSEYPLIIFTTPGSCVVPRADIGYAIVEDESSSLYKTSDRYALDTRLFIRHFTEHAGIKLFWGDTLPRFETLARTAKDHLPRTFVPDKLTIVPVEAYRTILPSEVIEIIRHAQVKKRHLYIHAARKGVAPLSRCSDCGTIVTCTSCELPVVLRNKVSRTGERERYFVCTHCATTLSATHTCVHCGGWNITPVAIGTESIRDAIVALVGSEPVITIDDDLTPDSAAIKTLIETTQKQKFSIVIGTIKVLPYLTNINYALFPFFDRLLSIPSLYTTEQTLRLIMECNERVTSGVLLFTRQPEFPFIRQLETQKINAIIHDELELRRGLGYPPYGSIIKISMTVPEGYRQHIAAEVSAFLGTIEHTALPPRRISAGSMKVLLVWILNVSTVYIEEEGPELSMFLGDLHFPYSIEENPERL